MERNQTSVSHLHKVSDSLSQQQWVTPCSSPHLYFWLFSYWHHFCTYQNQRFWAFYSSHCPTVSQNIPLLSAALPQPSPSSPFFSKLTNPKFLQKCFPLFFLCKSPLPRALGTLKGCSSILFQATNQLSIALSHGTHDCRQSSCVKSSSPKCMEPLL